MNRVYLKSLASFALIFFVILVVLLRQEPSIIMKQVGLQIERPSDTKAVMYAFVYALVGTLMIFFIERSKESS
jgi:presenilin-like A22 family membrane protease